MALSRPASRVGAGFEVVELDPLADPRWEAFVEAQPHRLVYHHRGWLEALAHGYGHSPLGLACQGPEGRLVGVLPLCATRGILSGRRLVSLPHTPVAGVLATAPEVTRALLEAAIGRVEGLRGWSLQIKAGSGPFEEPPDRLVGRPWSETYVLELPDPSEQLKFGSSRNHNRLKWAMNKARREGVTARDASSEEDLRAWYRIYLATMRGHAVPPRPYRFFKALWTSLRPKGLMRLLLAERREAGGTRMVAGSIFLTSGQSMFYAFNGCRRRDFDLRPNYLIQWCALHDAHEAGVRQYDLGEVEQGQEGLVTFKRKWGGRPQPFHRYYFPAPRELEQGALGQGGRVRDLAAGIWRRLPLGVTARAGELLYRHL